MSFFSKIKEFYEIQPLPTGKVSLSVQKKMWLKEFLKPFSVLCLVYSGMYLLRYNLKAAQPLLESSGFSTTELGNIGIGFSISYGLGRVILGYFIDGKNTKKILSSLLIISCIVSLVIGILLLANENIMGFFITLWAVNGLCQSPGGPCSNSTINRWTPRRLKGRFIGWWNVSHNIGGALAGVIALWGAEVLFDGNVAGMFIFPMAIALVIAIWGLFYGKDDPSELGWHKPEEIFDEPIANTDVESIGLSKKQILMKYVVKNPAVWLLCFANLFVYCVRIGVDNWAPLYTAQAMNYSNTQAALTLTFLEIGGFFGSMCWGYISDKCDGRRSLVAAICSITVLIPLFFYNHYTQPIIVYTSLFFEGFLIFGPVSLIGIAIIGFAPKGATVVINAIPGTFGYIFGDSMAKLFISRISDPKGNGLDFFGYHLFGWSNSFEVLYFSAIIAGVLLFIVAILEEKNIRKSKKMATQ